MKHSPINTSSIVILGYCLLVFLALAGFFTIYYEVIKSHRQSTDNLGLRQELIDLNNTLSTMYQAEGTANLLTFADNDILKLEYDSLTYRIFDQIDSLRTIASDPIIEISLDSLSTLLKQKRDNALEMFALVKQIDNNIIEEINRKTIITQNDITKLNNILANAIKDIEDTVQVTSGRRRNLFQRIGDLFNPNAQDTVTTITKSSVSETIELTTPVLVDTIFDFIRQIDKHKQQKNTEIIRQLMAHQHEMYIIKELTTFQIDKIMDSLQEREYQTNMELLNEKNESLKHSSKLVAIVGLSALIVAVFFMSWILHSLNKARQLQKSIQEAKKHAEKLLISREQLIYTITHDIKAPLSSIIGFLDLMSEDTFSQKQQYYINNMHLSTSHILDLVRNLLDFHSIEKEQPQLTNIAFLPDSLIHNIYESFLPLAQKKKIVFELNSTLIESKIFMSDPYYIRQIVNNLLSNAVKFTPEQGKILLITSMDEQNIWKISIQDNGPGMDLEDKAKIFDEFVRLDKTKKEVEGTGLGLTISKKLATLLGGVVDLESQKELGSTFTLTVPLTPVVEDTILQNDETSDVSSVKILFVDDDKVQLNLLFELMKKEGLSCVCCSSAYEALNILRKKSFDIIFTDIHIPDMEGFELVKRIKELNFHKAFTIPVIAFSAACQKLESELKTAGFSGFLLKPFKIQQLMEIIEKHTSFKSKSEETYLENGKSGWHKIIDLVAGDQEASLKIIDSFIEETNKDIELLKSNFQNNDSEVIKHISHKMLSLMRMISAEEIISILTDFESGEISKEKATTLFDLLEDTIKDAEVMRKNVGKAVTINNYEL